ncbi:MAG: hypothetical protein P1V97_35145 [Planctomycetota bacterium]|nr:hypothetical protein [Planctomycetota bacterium]
MSDHNKELLNKFEEDIRYFVERFEKRASNPGGEKFQGPLDRLYNMKDRLIGLKLGFGDEASSANDDIISADLLTQRLNDLKATTIDSIDQVHEELKHFTPALTRLEQLVSGSTGGAASGDNGKLEKIMSSSDRKVDRIIDAIPDLAADISSLSGSLDQKLDSIVSSLALISQRQEKLESRFDALSSGGAVTASSSSSNGTPADMSPLTARLDAMAKQLQGLRVPAAAAPAPAQKDEQLGQMTHSVRELEALVRNLLRELERHGRNPIVPGRLPGGAHKKPVNGKSSPVKASKRRPTKLPRSVEFPTGREPTS